MAEVVGFREDRVLLMPLGEMQGIGPGSRVVMKGHVASVPVGPRCSAGFLTDWPSARRLAARSRRGAGSAVRRAT